MSAATTWVLIAALLEPTAPLALQGSRVNALASGAQKARQNEVDAALEAYDKGDFVAAAEHFESAYAIATQPEDLFNAGRAHEEAGHTEQARRFYERFLGVPGLNKEQQTVTKERLLNLPSTSHLVAPISPREAMPQDDRPRRRPRREPKLHWASRTGIALMPVGAASLVAGAVFASTAKKNSKNAQNSTADGQGNDTPQMELAQRQARTANALLIAGGAVLGTGLVFLLSGLEVRRRAKRRNAQQRAAYRIQPQVGGLSVSF